MKKKTKFNKNISAICRNSDLILHCKNGAGQIEELPATACTPQVKRMNLRPPCESAAKITCRTGYAGNSQVYFLYMRSAGKIACALNYFYRFYGVTRLVSSLANLGIANNCSQVNTRPTTIDTCSLSKN